MPQKQPRNHSVYTARFDLYSAYTNAHDGTFAGPTNGTVVGRATSVRRNIPSGGYNAAGVYPRTAAPRHVEKLPNGSTGSEFGGEQSNIKIVSQLFSASGHFDSSLLPDRSCMAKV